MKEIYPNLHIGSQEDYENIVRFEAELPEENNLLYKGLKRYGE